MAEIRTVTTLRRKGLAIRKSNHINNRGRCQNRWSASGVWESVAIAPAETVAESGQYNIDSTTVRAHVSAAGAKGAHQRAFGRSRGGFTSKVHCLGDSRGRPIAFHLTPGEAANCKASDREDRTGNYFGGTGNLGAETGNFTSKFEINTG